MLRLFFFYISVNCTFSPYLIIISYFWHRIRRQSTCTMLTLGNWLSINPQLRRQWSTHVHSTRPQVANIIIIKRGEVLGELFFSQEYFAHFILKFAFVLNWCSFALIIRKKCFFFHILSSHVYCISGWVFPFEWNLYDHTFRMYILSLHFLFYFTSIVKPFGRWYSKMSNSLHGERLHLNLVENLN